jgi:hypothetical protein
VSNIFGIMAATSGVPEVNMREFGATYFRPASTNLLYEQTNSHALTYATSPYGWKLILTIRNSGGVASQFSPTNFTRSGGKVEITTSITHGLLVGQRIYLGGWVHATPPFPADSYDGAYVISDVTAVNKFKVVHTDDGAPTVNGLVYALGVDPADSAGGGQGYTQYRTDIQTLIANLGGSGTVPWIAVENEGTLQKQTYYYLDPTNIYRNVLSNAITAAHAVGVKVMTDGMLAEIVKAGVYWDYRDRGLTAEAESFRVRSSAGSPDVNDQARAKDWLDEAAAAGPDAVNIHLYGYTDDLAMVEAANWVRSYSGIQTVLSNETGTPSSSISNVFECFSGPQLAGFPVAVQYGSTGSGGATAELISGAGVLSDFGQTWAALIHGLTPAPTGTGRRLAGALRLPRV